ncbi:MAG: histidinol phosphate phosphatase [Gammaproteobacteria bacterium]|nr:histidinol phosphate phosphatase [Gammaproteobacteria bacterium]
MSSVPAQFLKTAVAAADAARRVTGKYFRANLEIASKDDRSPVTVADAETEQCIREVILQRHPRHAILGEEGGASGGDPNSEWRWVVDPIDGTKSFASGNPTFGTLIGLLRDGVPQLGVIDHAALNERWIGVKGEATTFNSAPCKTGGESRPGKTSIYATTPDMFTDPRARRRFAKLSGAFQFRVFGGDCYSYGLLASGFVGAVCDASLFPYDFLPLVPVVEGAGGVITDWGGKKLSLESNGEVLAAANAELHKAALVLLED